MLLEKLWGHVVQLCLSNPREGHPSLLCVLVPNEKKLCSKPITFFASRGGKETGKVEPLLADQIELLENADDDGVITNILHRVAARYAVQRW